MMNELMTAAENGDIASQLALGIALYTGDGMEKNRKEAAKWFGKAAAAGNAEAQYWYGICYEGGYADDRIRNYGDAAKWYAKSAKQGYAPAEAKLGSAYYEGNGVDKDLKKAVKWCQAAVEQGDSDAMLTLGDIYYMSDDSDTCGKAFELFNNASAAKKYGADVKLAACYENGVGVEADYDKAIEMYKNSEHYEAANGLNTLYAKLILNDDAVIRSKYVQILTDEEPKIITQTAYVISNGNTEVQSNKAESIKWFELAAAKGCDEANYALAYRYTVEDEGVALDYAKAIEYYKIAANKGNSRAIEALVEIYDEGEIVEKNEDEVLKWCKIGADNGDTNILIYATDIYLKRKNYIEAVKSLKLRKLPHELAKVYFKAFRDKKNLGIEEREELRKSFENETSDMYFQYASLHRYDSKEYWQYTVKAASMGNQNVIELLVKLLADNLINIEKLDGLPEMYMGAAENGNPYAMYALGYHYEYGIGVAQDKAKAEYWYKLSAEQKYSKAVQALNEISLNGGGKIDYEEKIKNCRECDDDDALYELYLKYYETADVNGRAKLINLAAEERTYILDKIALSLFAGTDVYDLEECRYFDRDYSDVIKLLKAGADKNSNTSKYYLACCYDYGIGTERNINEAIKWYTEAAEDKSDIENGNRAAMIALGYLSKYGDNPNEKISAKWYRQAKKAEDDIGYDNAVEAYEMGCAYHNDDEEPDEDEEDYRDYGLAWKFYIFAIEGGVTDAYVNMADLYEKGLGVKANMDIAVRLNLCVAEMGNRTAQANIGECYYNGYVKGVEHDEAMRLSEEWYKKAAKKGCKVAKTALKECFGITEIK